jgi:hypothetical protein
MSAIFVNFVEEVIEVFIWMIAPSMEFASITAYKILTRFCRDVRILLFYSTSMENEDIGSDFWKKDRGT